MIPLFTDLAGKRVIIFGGGPVAVRKAAFFSPEADVTVVSRSHAGALAGLPVHRLVMDVRDAGSGAIGELVRDAFLVVAALPDKDLNNLIGRICRDAGILFNNAGGGPGDVIVPSVSKGKRYTIAVTTHGKSPAVSRYIRERIDEEFRMLDEMIALQERLRREIRKTEPSQERRSAILRDVIRDPDVWNALARESGEAELIARRRYLDA